MGNEWTVVCLGSTDVSLGKSSNLLQKANQPFYFCLFLLAKNDSVCKQSPVLLVSRLQCKYFSCRSLTFQTLKIDISSKINT